MSYFRVILIFLLIFLRCNTSTFTSGDINIDFPEIEIPRIPFHKYLFFINDDANVIHFIFNSLI
jgi:hypothetical protein